MASVSTEGDSAVLPQFAEPKNPSNTNNGEHNANSNVFISGGFGKIGPKSFSEDILCASCSEAHFESSILPNDRYTVVVATSTVGAILSNKKCPSCRLIFHCMKSLRRVKSISLESQISLFAAPEFFHPRTGRHGKYIKKSLPKRVEIRLHTKKPEDEEGIDIKDHDIIGFLLPVMTEEISNSIGLTNHKALFNTLEYRGSVYVRSVASTVNTELLRAWMDFCIASHGSCRITKAPNDANTEVRLIDVVERRLIDATLVEEYVAFSYVWGPGNNKVLMENTLKHFQEKGSLTPSTVPRLVADVMDFVAEIGERYLWIDTACIIQDDPLDKQRQLPNMSSIYTHAKLTIVAAVEGANDPLPRLNGYHYKAPVPIELIQGLPYTIGEPPLVAALERTTWNSRGWTFQEALLARRLLVFTEDLTYWSCREESWCEDQYTEFHDLKNVPTPQSSLLAIDSRRSNCNRKASAVFRLSSMELYAKHAQTYSRRSFSNYSDIVWAFLGILKDMKEGFPNGYVWALPHDRLDSALLWLACCERTQCLEHQYGTSHQSRLMIPSWCWIGKGHNIWFMNGIDNIISRVTWHEPVKCWSSEIDSVDDDQELTHSSQASALSDTQSTRENSVAFDYAFLHFTAQTAMLTIELGSDRSNLVIFNTYNGNELADPEFYPLVVAKILGPSKRAIGQISVPAYIFRNSTQQLQEFALLSEYTSEIHSEVLNNDTRPVGEWKSGKGSAHDRGEDDAGSPHQKQEEAKDIGNEKDQNQALHDAERRFFSKGHKEGCSHQPALNVMLIEWDKTHNTKNFARRVGITRINPSAWEEVETTEKTITLG